ncbi:DNA primase [Lysobacter sp. P5_B9]
MTETAFALQWEKLANEGTDAGLLTERARVFGGWLVRVGSAPNAMALTFVPDGEGRWDGEDFGEDDYEYEEGEGEESDDEESDEEDEEYEEEEDA